MSDSVTRTVDGVPVFTPEPLTMVFTVPRTMLRARGFTKPPVVPGLKMNRPEVEVTV